MTQDNTQNMEITGVPQDKVNKPDLLFLMFSIGWRAFLKDLTDFMDHMRSGDIAAEAFEDWKIENDAHLKLQALRAWANAQDVSDGAFQLKTQPGGLQIAESLQSDARPATFHSNPFDDPDVLAGEKVLREMQAEINNLASESKRNDAAVINWALIADVMNAYLEDQPENDLDLTLIGRFCAFIDRLLLHYRKTVKEA